MTGEGRPPRLATVLLRVLRLGEARAEVEADLLELFLSRAAGRGRGYARRRYVADVLSLAWRRPAERSRRRRPARPRPFGGLALDLTHAGRLVRRHPGTVAVAVAGLAMGIAVCTAVFSVLNAVVIRRTGLVEPESAVRVSLTSRNGVSNGLTYAVFVRLGEGSPDTPLAATLSDGSRVGMKPNDEAATPVALSFVSGGYFQTLTDFQGRAALGRLLDTGDDRAGAEPALVASYGFWRNRLGGDAGIIGRRVWLGSAPAPFTVIGVAARGFAGLGGENPPAFWVPLSSYHIVYGGDPFGRETTSIVRVIARLPHAVSHEQARAHLGAVAARTADPASADGDRVTGVAFEPADQYFSGSALREVAGVIAIVTAVVGLVLVLACANVANLLLASAAERQREIGVRLALGATRGRVIRQLLAESLALGTAGGGLGLILTFIFVPVLAAVTRAPSSLDLAPDLRVYAFLAAVSVLAGVMAGLAPARQSTRGDLVGALKSDSAGANAASASRPVRVRSVLIGLQAAASTMLLIVAALLVRGAVRVATVDPGLDADHLVAVTAAFDRGATQPDRMRAWWSQARDRARAVPGVERASLVLYAPFGDAYHVSISTRNGNRYVIYRNDTDADFFRTAGIRIVRGRTYSPDEVASADPVVVITEQLARDFWAGEDPIGSSIARLGVASHARVIGVAVDALTGQLRDVHARTIYAPLSAADEPAVRMLVRTARPDMSRRPLQEALGGIDSRVRPEATLVEDSLVHALELPRDVAAIAVALAGIALLLAVVGIHGVTAFAVGQRRREVGVRIALGAGRADVLRLLVRDSLRPIVAGISVALVLALVASRAMTGALYGLSADDPLAFSAAAGLVIAAALTAVLVPARRAAGIDPAAVLRQS